MTNPSTGAIPTVEDFRAHVARSNLRADPYDENDYPWVFQPQLEVPPTLTLRLLVLLVRDQLRQGSCVSNSGPAQCEILKQSLHGDAQQLASDYDYYRGRDIDPTTAPPKDIGMTLKQGFQSRKRWGICLEKTRPYSMATYNNAPTAAEDAEAALHRVTEYRRGRGSPYQDMATTIRYVKESLTLGYPVQIGMSIEEDFFSLKGPCNGKPYNYAGLQKIGAVNVGGHAMVITGYYQRGALDYFEVLNSWGTTWGDGGFALLPMSVIAGTDCWDMWSVTSFDGVSEPDAATQQADTFVSRLYVAMFGRAPDAEGLAYWTLRYTHGEPLESIAGAMYGTDPARAYYPLFLTNQEVAAAFYVNVLGRQPDADGLAYWTQQINALGTGAALQRMAQVSANYDGADAGAILASDRFNRRVRAARIYAEKGGDIAGAHDAIANVN